VPTFSYKIQTSEGEIAEGKKEAKDKLELVRLLKQEGNIVILVDELDKKGLSLSLRFNVAFGRVKLLERVVFMRNLGAMIKAGLPLSRSLDVLRKQTKNQKLKKIIASIAQDINKGSSLSGALAKFPNVFSSLSIAMVRVGEESGTLPKSLELNSIHLDRNYRLKKRVKGALMYPLIIIMALFFIGTLMFIYVVPTLTQTFKELGVELPLSTTIIIVISDFLRFHTILALMTIVGVVLSVYFFFKSAKGERTFDFIVLRIPVIGPIIKEVYAAQTSNTLASLLSAGVQMIESIKITRDVIQNSFYKDILKEAEIKVGKGIALSKVFQEHEGLYPVLVGEMIAVGEETGRLSDMLMQLATFYEDDVEQKTKDLSTIIEPILMVIVGAGVGFFAISMITPLYTVLLDI